MSIYLRQAYPNSHGGVHVQHQHLIFNCLDISEIIKCFVGTFPLLSLGAAPHGPPVLSLSFHVLCRIWYLYYICSTCMYYDHGTGIMSHRAHGFWNLGKGSGRRSPSVKQPVRGSEGLPIVLQSRGTRGSRRQWIGWSGYGNHHVQPNYFLKTLGRF